MSVAKRLLDEEGIKRYAKNLQKKANSGEFGIDVTGILELRETLQLLERKLQNRIIIKIIKEAGQVIYKDMRRRAPRDGGKLERSIKIIAVKQKSGVPTVIIRPHLDRASKSLPYYAKWVEGGTADRYPKKPSIGSGKKTQGRALVSDGSGIRRYFVKAKGIKARPFVSQTYFTTREQFVRDFEKLSTELIKEALLNE